VNFLKKLINYIFQRYTTINKIAFFINEEYIFDHYFNVIKKLDTNHFDIVLDNKFQKNEYKNFINKLNFHSFNVVFLKDVLLLKKYKILITHLYLGGDKIDNGTILFRLKTMFFHLMKKIGINWLKLPPDQYFQKKLGLYNIRFMYGADVGGDKFGKFNHLFDEFFCHGPNDSKFIKERFDGVIYEMGYPKYDNYFYNLNNEEFKNDLLKKHLCNSKKPTILWICTVSKYFSTIETYEQAMSKLTEKYNIILRPHPLEITPGNFRYNEKVDEICNSDKFIVRKDPLQNMSELYFIADKVFCDYGGSIFGALYLNKDIILMNHRNAHMDPGIYRSTSMDVRNYLPSINEEDFNDIQEIIDNVLPSSQVEIKTKEARKIFFGENKGGTCSNLVAHKLKVLYQA
jgi:hypothetical protein